MRPRNPAAGLAALVLALALALNAVSVPVAAAATRRFISGWIPYWSTTQSLQGFQANADLFSDVSPFWHSLTSDTTVTDQESSADRTMVINGVRAAGVPLVPAITDGTGSGQLAAALGDAGRRATLVQTLVGLVTSRGYDGLDLDLEGFAYSDSKSTWLTTRPNWVAFVSVLGQQLHSRGKVLYATIPPTYDSNRSDSSGYWVYDYAGIAPNVDRVRIMAYDYSVGSPGPIAPYSWVQRIVNYAQTQIPKAKLVLGTPAYGRDWPTKTSGTCPAGQPRMVSRTSSAAWQLAADQGVQVQWDASARERTFQYTQTISDAATSCQVSRTVYFSDSSAVSDRARLAYTSQWAGVAIWSLGSEDSGTWPLLRTLANGLGYPLFSGQVLEIQVAGGATGVPSDAEAVNLNVTATEPRGAGFLRVYPCGGPMPATSNVNFAAGQTVGNNVTVGVGSNGTVCVATMSTTHVVVDYSGYFPKGSPFQPLTPQRLLDSRTGKKPSSGTDVALGVPAGAAAVALSVTATEPDGSGWVAAYPCGTPFNGTANINYFAGQTIAGSALATPGPDGRVCLRVSASTHLVVDLMGVFGAGTDFSPLAPVRLADTRISPGGPVPAGTEVAVPVGVTASAVAVNVAITQPETAGWVQAYPCGTPPSQTSSVNFAAGQTISNAAIVAVGSNGKLCLRGMSTTHMVIDRMAAFGPGHSYFAASSPRRVADTRLP